MKLIFSLLFIQLALISFSSEKGILIPELMLLSSEKSSDLKPTESKFVFQCSGFIDEPKERTIVYSLNGENRSQLLNSKNEFEVTTGAGINNFQFFYNEDYFEIYADSLIIQKQFVDTYSIRFESSKFPVMVDKPIIYLYPENETSFTVCVNSKGKMAFTYPDYTDSWKGTASPNGNLTIGEESFNYLFWEADQDISTSIINPKKGSIVEGSNATIFLTEQLNAFGLTSKEKADFITFWGPKLVRNEFNYIYFVLNNEANYFAELAITPKPDNIYRFYILTCPVANPSDFHYLEPQLIEFSNREGFTIVEWGGSVIDINYLKKRLQYL